MQKGAQPGDETVMVTEKVNPTNHVFMQASKSIYGAN